MKIKIILCVENNSQKNHKKILKPIDIVGNTLYIIPITLLGYKKGDYYGKH